MNDISVIVKLNDAKATERTFYGPNWKVITRRGFVIVRSKKTEYRYPIGSVLVVEKNR